jgi:hypothetical protein
MAFIPVPNTAQIRLEGRLDNQQTINDLYFFQDGGFTSLELEDLTANVFSWWNTSIVTVLNEGFSSLRASARDLTTENGISFETATGASSGGVSGEAAPNNVAPAVSFRTGMAGRSFRGRNYIPGISNSSVVGNNVDAGWRDDILNGYSLLLPAGSVLPGTFVWVVASRFSGVDVDGKPIPRLAGIVTTITAVIFTDTVVDSQRRRLPGRGK